MSDGTRAPGARLVHKTEAFTGMASAIPQPQDCLRSVHAGNAKSGIDGSIVEMPDYGPEVRSHIALRHCSSNTTELVLEACRSTEEDGRHVAMQVLVGNCTNLEILRVSASLQLAVGMQAEYQRISREITHSTGGVLETMSDGTDRGAGDLSTRWRRSLAWLRRSRKTMGCVCLMFPKRSFMLGTQGAASMGALLSKCPIEVLNVANTKLD